MLASRTGRSISDVAGIDGDGALRRYGEAERAQGPGAGQFAEEDVAGIFAHQGAPAVGRGAHPGLDGLQAHIVARELPAVAQQAADGNVGAAILLGIADAHDAAVRQVQPPGALDLQEEQVDRVDRIGDLEATAGEPAFFDLGTR
jgi:hypothetical protein